jgi:sugar phosphate permease
MGGGMIGIASTHSLALMGALILLAIAPGANAIGSLTASTLAARWFSRQRGKALGVTSVATSMGGFCIVPLIAFNIDHFGWRDALLLQGGIIIAVAIALTLWLVHGRPQDIGLQPDGDETAAGAATAAGSDVKQWTFKALAREPDFWQIALCVGILFGISQALLASMVPYATDIGIGLAEATLLVSALSISSVFGKLVIGAVADHADKRWLLMIVIVCTIGQLLLLIGKFDFTVLLVCCLLAGFAMGGELPLWGALVAERFGARSFGAVMGLMNPLIMLCNLGAVFAIGRAFDTFGNYDAAFLGFIGAAVVSAILALRLKPTPVRVPLPA